MGLQKLNPIIIFETGTPDSEKTIEQTEDNESVSNDISNVIPFPIRVSEKSVQTEATIVKLPLSTDENTQVTIQIVSSGFGVTAQLSRTQSVQCLAA